MARTFQMGAKMTLKDQFKGTISKIARSTLDFKKNVDTANKSVRTFKDSTGRLRDETGKYVSQGGKASAMSRTWISANGKLSSSFSLVKRGIMGAAAAFGLYKAKSWLVDANADMETYRNTLTVVLKDEKKATDMLTWATKFAAKTPFEIPGIVEATTRLQSYGIDAQKTLSVIGDMASVMGKDLMQAVEAVADAQTGELERLKEFGITKKQIEAQAKLMKVTVTNNQGQITDQKAFNAVLFKLMEDRYKGGMEMQSKTFKGMISNIQDFIGQAGRILGAPIFDAVKDGLAGTLDWLNKIQDSGALNKLQGKISGVITFVRSKVGPVLAWVKNVAITNINKIRDIITAFIQQNQGKIILIWKTLKNVFTSIWANAKPVLTWLANNALPLIVDYLTWWYSILINIATGFIRNWGKISPIVYAIVGALVAYKAAMIGIVVAQKAAMIIEALSKAWRVASAVLAMFQAGASLATVAQWALNAAMTANPVGVIVVAIGALIAIIVLLAKNWDTVGGALMKGAQAIGNFFVGIWEWIKQTAISTFTSVGDFIGGIFNGLVDILKAPVNFIIQAINTMIKGLNGLNISVPDWVPLIGGKKFGFNIPELPYLAKGTNNWSGGPAYMNERGGEMAILPKGSQVIPADKTDKVLDRPKGTTIHIEKLIEKLEIKQRDDENTDDFINRLITKLYEKLKEAEEIANSAGMGVLVNG